MVTVVCPGPIETSNAPDTSTSGQRGVKEVSLKCYVIQMLQWHYLGNNGISII